jgi:hypothetical protein
MAGEYDAIASAAGLSDAERKKIERLNKSLSAHKSLLNLPADVATRAADKLTPAQRADLQNTFGTESPEEKPNRGWFGTAWHYTGYQAFKGLTAVSDFMTRIPRTLQIAADEDLNLGDAWEESGKDGEKKFNENRLEDARRKYGKPAVDIAMRISSGEDVSAIMATATPEEMYYLQIADKTIKTMPGITSPEQLDAARDLFDDTLGAVNAAKYSPGRWVANIIDEIVPGDFYENGFFYKLTSGVVDALYRLRTDPFIVGGKAKRLYDLRKYSLEAIVGAGRSGNIALVNNYFNQPQTIDFWNKYGTTLKKLKDSKGKTVEAATARKELQIMAPQFGPAVIKDFIKSEVFDVNTAKAYVLNGDDAFKIMNGQAARKRIILPRLTAARKARVATLTAANRVFDFDKVGPALIDDVFFGAPATDDGIFKVLTDENVGAIKKGLQTSKDMSRFSMAMIVRNIDNIKRKFTPVPMFRNNEFDLMAPDASEKIYRTAAMIMPTREARLISETFEGIDSVNKRFDIYLGLWRQIADVKGIDLSDTGNSVVRTLANRGQTRFSLDATDAFANKPLLPTEMNTLVTAPSIADVNRLAARSTLYRTTLGLGNSKAGEFIVSSWSFLTLAGPRYAIRNAGEDLMVNIAIGGSVWGLTKNRYLSTRVNTVIKEVQGLKGFEAAANNPLGIGLRFLNKKESDVYLAKFKDIQEEFTKNSEELKDIRRLLQTEDTPALRAKAAELEEYLSTNITDRTRLVMAEALSTGRVNRFLDRMGIPLLGKQEIDLLTDQIAYGDIENLFSMVSEGGFNFASGADYVESASNLVKTLNVKGGALRLNLDGATGRYAPAAGQSGFREVGIYNEASLISYLLRISFYANDELGAIAIANLSDNTDEAARAVTTIANWIKTDKGKKLMSEARITSTDQVSELEYAQLVYNRARQLFARRSDGMLNTELLDKVRVFDPIEGKYTVSGRLSLDDLPKTAEGLDNLPAAVVGPELVPVSGSGNVTADVMKNGWVWLGLANARMSRQPLALYEMVQIRKTMRSTGFEDAFISNYTKGISPVNTRALSQATVSAKKELAKLVEERAINNVLAYVDNPLIRSQVAFSARNFARFYRAQEDFYRRLYRLVRYNPASIQKIALTIDGAAHTGWIQKDDRGEMYFVYPDLTPGYRAVQGVLTALGKEQDFKVPFPVQFSGSVKMLTPSMNPDSFFPTFSGPLAAIPMTLIENLVNIFQPGMGDTIARYSLGTYSEDTDIVSRMLPAHVNRAIQTFNQDERNSQFASASRKAAVYLESAGHGIPKKYDEDGQLLPPSAGELEEYRQRLRNTTLSLLAFRFTYGFFAPASPSTQLKSDMSEWIRDNGKANWKQAWTGLRDQYPDLDSAMRRWVELYPNLVPYTVGESDRKTVAYFTYAEESNKFVTENEGLFKKYPQAAAFLIPHKGGFSFDAYKTMTAMGLQDKKRVEDYLKDVQIASDRQIYYSKRDEYERNLERAFDPLSKTIARERWNTWRTNFLVGRPLLAEDLSQGGQRAIERVNALTDLETMLSNPEVSNIRSDVQGALREMLSVYMTYKKQSDTYGVIGMDRAVVDAVKEGTIRRIKNLALFNENTQAAYDQLFGPLLQD